MKMDMNSCLQQIISQMIVNSINVKSTSIACRTCLELFWFQIIDNGFEDGIQLSLDISLKEISKQCEEIVIESHPLNSSKTEIIVFKNGVALNDANTISTYQSTRGSIGTTITLKNLFYKDKFIYKKINQKKAAKDLVTLFQNYSIIFYGISFSLCDITTSILVFNSERTSDFPTKLMQIFNLRCSQIRFISCKKDDIIVTIHYWEKNKKANKRIKNIYENNIIVRNHNILDLIAEYNFQFDFIMLIEYPKSQSIIQDFNEQVVLNCVRKCLTDESVLIMDAIKDKYSSLNLKPIETSADVEKKLSSEDSFFQVVTSEPRNDLEISDNPFVFGEVDNMDITIDKRKKIYQWLYADNNLHLPYSDDDFPNDMKLQSLNTALNKIEGKKIKSKTNKCKDEIINLKKTSRKTKKKDTTSKKRINITDEINKLFRDKKLKDGINIKHGSDNKHKHKKPFEILDDLFSSPIQCAPQYKNLNENIDNFTINTDQSKCSANYALASGQPEKMEKFHQIEETIDFGEIARNSKLMSNFDSFDFKQLNIPKYHENEKNFTNMNQLDLFTLALKFRQLCHQTQKHFILIR